MKICIVGLLICLILAIIFGATFGLREYRYNVNIGQYLRLADDASTPKAKYDYLQQFRTTITENISRNDARYIFKQGRYTKKAQLEILDTLIDRLSGLITLSADSMAYQQGMLQISGQEFDHTLNEINNTFKDCYFRNSFFVYASGLFCCIFSTFAVIFGIGILVVILS